MSKTIVVAAHGNDEQTQDALALGVRLARALRGQLVLAGIWVSPLGPGDGVYDRAVREEVERELAALRGEVPQDVPTSVDVRGATSVMRGLHQVVEDVGGDVLVMGPTHYGRVGRLAHGSVASSAIHDAPCAVAVAPRGYRQADAAERTEVVVGWDGSPEAGVALTAAAEVAGGLGGGVRLVHVIESPSHLADRQWVGAPAPEAWLTELRDHASQTLDDGAALVPEPVPVRTELVEGVASIELARSAEDAALLVVGSRGYGALRRLLLGSTSADLLARDAVAVLVMPRTVDAAGTEPAAATAATAER